MSWLQATREKSFLPKFSDKYGGWLGEQVVEDFADYARVCYKAFGDLVNFWITINEPHVVAHQGSVSFIKY